ncbi:MAG: carboxypeptidase-like regulatory domain-containing protein, partial [Halalkalicoccus sp.]
DPITRSERINTSPNPYEIDHRLRIGGELMTQTTEVAEDGTIEAVYDVSDYEEGDDLTVRMTDSYDGDVTEEVNAILVEDADGPAPHSVTITVEDADGEPVEGADVEVSNGDTWTETTDANGEATFELAHGEYDVTASYDGEEATGSLTVDDDATDDDTEDQPGFGIAVALIALLAAAGIALRKRA